MSGKSLYLLQVDDDENDRILFDRAVKRCALPIQVAAIASGLDALARLRNAQSGKPDFVLVDIRMPVMSGFEFIAELKKEDRFRNLPIVMLSTSAQPGDIQRARDLGAASYYVKPDGMDQLTELIQDLYSRWSRADLHSHWPAGASSA
jgi:CheY-like chemotaxis protein